MSTFELDRLIALYELEPIRLEDGKELRRQLANPVTRWYATRRLRALATAGLVAAGNWDPVLHPRGRDGQFIDKFGFVRWLLKGEWQRGKVAEIDDKGRILVKPDRPDAGPPHGTQLVVRDGNELIEFGEPSQQLYALPKPKATLALPNPASKDTAEGWTRTSGAMGSNVGGMYKADTPQSSQSVLTEGLIDKATEKAGLTIGEAMSAGDLAKVDAGVASYTDHDGQVKAMINHPDTGGWVDSQTLEPVELPSETEVVLYTGSPQQVDQAANELQALEPDPVKTGDKFYVKNAKSQTHAKVEVLANLLYERAGVAVGDVSFGENGTTLSSKIVASDDELTLEQALADPELAKEIRSNLAVDAWLANWDVAGLVLDNMKVVDGVPYRIDAGGALLYRAQGSPKGDKFGPKVGELKTLRDKSLNPAAAKVFGATSHDELVDGGNRVAAISPAEIQEAVADIGLDPSLADTLIARRKDLIDQLGLEDPHAKKAAADEKFAQLVEAGNAVPPAVDLGPPPVVISEPKTVVLDANQLKVKHDASTAYLDWLDGFREDNAIEVGGETLAPGEHIFINDRIIEIGEIVEFPSTETWGITGVDPFDGQSAGTMISIGSGVSRLKFGTDLAEYQQQRAKLTSESFPSDLVTYPTVKSVMVGPNYDDPTLADPARIGSTKPIVVDGMMMLPDGYGDDKGPDKKDWLYAEELDELFEVVGVTYEATGLPYRLQLVNHKTGKETTLNKDSSMFHAMTWKVPANQHSSDLVSTMAAVGEMWAKKEDEDDKQVWNVTADDDDEALANWLNTSSPIVQVDETPDLPDDAVAEAADDTDNVEPGTATYSINGVNATLLPVEEPVVFKELHEADGNQGFEAMVGKTVVIPLSLEGTPVDQSTGATTVWGSPNSGLWYVESFTPGPEGGNQFSTWLTLRAANGATTKIHPHNSSTFSEVDVNVTTPMPPPQLKSNGDVVVQGVVIGKHSTSGWTSKKYEITIDPAYSVTGTKIKLTEWKLKDLKRRVGPLIVPPAHVEAKSKPASAGELEHAAKAAASATTPGDVGVVPAAGAMIDGSPLTVGMKVTSLKDGSSGVVAGFPDQEKYPGLVRVKMDNGKTTYRKATTLKGEAPAAPATPNPYAHLKTADGKAPAIGQTVKSGKSGSSIEGLVVAVNPSKGWVKVQTADGKKAWKTLGTTTVVSEPAAGTPAPAAAGALITPGPGPSAAAKLANPSVKYPGPGGAVLEQSNEIREQWVADGRKLTKDGYALTVGTRVRDSKGNPYIVAEVSSKYSANSSSVKLSMVGSGAYVTRQASALHVDHDAEMTNSAGESLLKAKEVTVIMPDGTTKVAVPPDGSIIYKTTTMVGTQSTGGYRSVETDAYYIVKPDDTEHVQKIDSAYAPTSSAPSKHLIGHLGGGKGWEKVAVIDSGASQSIVAKSAYDKTYKHEANLETSFEAYDAEQVAPEQVVADAQLKKLEVESDLTPGTGAAKPFLVNQIPPLVPSDADKAGAPEAPTGPKPPQLTADKSEVAKVPETLAGTNATSAVGAVERAIASKDSKAPGSGLHYGVGDSDYVEDMTYRAQVVVDESGKEHVELRFRLMEEKTDELATKLTSYGTSKYGAWKSTKTAHVTDLVAGDAISVRVSSNGQLKPGKSGEPNARVVEAPTLIGTSKSGRPLYRVRVANANGELGEVDIELREAASVQLYEYDPTMQVHSAGGAMDVSPEASKVGWSVRHNTMGYQKGGTTISVNETGAKVVGQHWESGYQTQGQGQRLQRVVGQGTDVQVNVVHPGMGGTSPGNPRRSQFNGDVTIRVSTAKGVDLEEEIARALEAVGIPVEAQGPPSRAQLAQMAIGKVDKTYSPTYKHRQRTDATGLADDPGTATVLAKVDAVAGKNLGRKVTLDDVHYHVHEDGRLQVIMSPEVGKAVSARQGNTAFVHNLTGGVDVTKLVNMIAGQTPGLLSTDERWSAGITTHGMSSDSDMRDGTGDHVYISGTVAPSMGGSSAYGGAKVVLSPAFVNQSTELYANASDNGTGKRKENNNWWAIQKGYEYPYKRAIPVEAWAYLMVDPTARAELIKQLHARGITQIGGRPIEEVIRSMTDKIDLKDPAFVDLGTTVGQNVTLGGVSMGGEV